MNNSTPKDDDHGLKERILISAIEEFGRMGYEAGSTNTIVRSAGVSKGSLFHYFGSKKNLFIECTLHVLNSTREYIFENLDFTDTDLFSVLKKSLELKLKFYKDYPEFMGMASKAWYSENRIELEERLPQYLGSYKEYGSNPVLKNIDRTMLKEGMDFNMVVEYTGLLMEACWLRFSAKYNDDAKKIAANTEEFLAEVDTVLDLIKRGACKDDMKRQANNLHG